MTSSRSGWPGSPDLIWQDRADMEKPGRETVSGFFVIYGSLIWMETGQ